MKKNKIDNLKMFCECIIEKCMEWIVFICNSFRNRREWRSNLSEHYCIYKDYIGKEYVKVFLDERERILKHNTYKMNIEIICEKGEPNVVGKVFLYRKKQIIHQATLKVKSCERNGGIIFWSFEKEK